MTKLNWEKANRTRKPKQRRKVTDRSKVIKAYENGSKNERARILNILEEIPVDFNMNDYSVRTIAVAIERINNAKSK